MIIELFSERLVDWSRLQFAMTAIYHYLFVPLTLGLSFLLAIFETMWYRTRAQEWLVITRFWMRLFAINFAIGVATGLILEFQFGSNWSNYSWFVGDVFGAPLAIEGIMAFFLESTFVAVMFFGWNKVSPRFHLVSTWLVVVGSNISALWILIANAWMQNPVGMVFNPDTARNEMVDFAAMVFSSTSINKISHTVLSAYTLSACFVIGVSAWLIVNKRDKELSRKSIKVAGIFGIIAIIGSILTGDSNGRNIAVTQPMKLAAMEDLSYGGKGIPLSIIGYLHPNDTLPDFRLRENSFSLEIPDGLSLIAFHRLNAYVPGIMDIINGYTDEAGRTYPPVSERIANGKKAIIALSEYKKAQEMNDTVAAQNELNTFRANYADFGYGYLSSPYELIPPLSLIFYSFRIMVGLGFVFVFLFLFSLWWIKPQHIDRYRFVPYFAIFCVPMVYLATQCGWIVSEVGRQPWIIQDIMLTKVGVTAIASSMVVTTFWMFAILFTVLLIAELTIMFTQIRKGF